MSLQTNLARLRAIAGLSARELSQRAGLSPGLVAQIERATKRAPTLDTLSALARVLGVTIDVLLAEQRRKRGAR